jgi:hypothetical protein
MTKKAKLRTILALLITSVLGGGYMIAAKGGAPTRPVAGETGFAAFH